MSAPLPSAHEFTGERISLADPASTTIPTFYEQVANLVAAVVKWDEHHDEDEAAERSDEAGDAMRNFLADHGIKTEMHHTCCTPESFAAQCPNCGCTGDEFCSWRVTPSRAFDWKAFDDAANTRFGKPWRGVVGWD